MMVLLFSFFLFLFLFCGIEKKNLLFLFRCLSAFILKERECVTVYGVSVEEIMEEIASMIFFFFNFYPLKKTTSLSYLVI